MKSCTEIIVKPDDIDHLGHVNYMKYLYYLESGIGEWYRQAGVSMYELDQKNLGTVLIKFDLSYLREARLGDSLKVVTELMQVGNKSFVLKQDIINQNDVHITECTKTFVMFNTITRKSTAVIEGIARHFNSVR
jgi:YbgC/YbaW family acyl-CoA thioester hydrolase